MINGEERVLICFSQGGKSDGGGFVKDGVSQVMVIQ